MIVSPETSKTFGKRGVACGTTSETIVRTRAAR
jgi:hypothetical protein